MFVKWVPFAAENWKRLAGLSGDAFRQRQIAVLVRHDNSSMSI
jgi:hypothetical protein